MIFFAHPKALVETDQIGAGTKIRVFAHVMDGALICVCDCLFL
jgi:hypothetical protein